MYSTATCPYCIRARDLLQRKGVSYRDIRVDALPEQRAIMMAKSGRHTVPQIFINDQPIGGCDDLYALDYEGRLDTLLTT
jgi:glutaredoxin 3